MQNTPFLNGFSTLLCGRAKQSAQAKLRHQLERVQSLSLDGLGVGLEEEISARLLDSLSITQRERIYGNVAVFWAWLGQVFSADRSCAQAVARIQQWFRRKKSFDQKMPSADTGSYCLARQRLPVEMLREVNRSLCDQLNANLPQESLWRGAHVFAEDGTSAQLPDTPENQASFPQPTSQAEGCGFPVVRLGGLINLGHGGLEDFSTSSLEVGEARGHDRLVEYLQEGDVLVADRLYSSYEIIAGLSGKGVFYVGRAHQARKIDFRQGKKIGADQRLIEMEKPRQPPRNGRVSAEDWAALPGKVSLRIIRTKGLDREGKTRTIYVVTTLLEEATHPAEEIVSLNFHRWEIELRFRDIKTTLGMEMLSTKAPETVEKELLVYLIAYNLIRLLMLKAAAENGVSHRRVSFKGVIQVLEACRERFESVAGKPRLFAEEKGNLLERVAERIVPDRPGRNEPRKKKRRPKSYGWLQKPRHNYFEHFRNDSPPAKILAEIAETLA